MLLALVPGTALWLMLGLSVVALVVAPLVDRLAGARRFAADSCRRLAVLAPDWDRREPVVRPRTAGHPQTG